MCSFNADYSLSLRRWLLISTCLVLVILKSSCQDELICSRIYLSIFIYTHYTYIFGRFQDKSNAFKLISWFGYYDFNRQELIRLTMLTKLYYNLNLHFWKE